MKTTLKILAVLAWAACWAGPASALILNQEDITWSTDNDIVTFQMTFYNPELTMSEPASGTLYSQEFGAFVPHTGTIGTFDIPPIPPESFFDVFFDIELSQLPPSSEEVTPWSQGGGGKVFCGQDWHWDGNVDVIWTGAGGGTSQAHYGTLQACPGAGGSYIHVVTGCGGNITYGFAGVCAGFNVTLVNEDFTPAPAALPPGWSGWICVTANASVPVGTTCCFTVNFNCAGVVVPVRMCVTACDCSPVDSDTESWGSIKSLFR